MLSSPAQSVLELIGQTPVLRLNRVQHQLGLRGRLMAKLEQFNPGGSKKDRVALEIIRTAKKQGRLVRDQPVVEVTSGNTGTGLAIVCRAMGHPFFAVMSRGCTRERAQMMRAFGAEVVLIDQDPASTPGMVSSADMKLVRARAAELVKSLGAFYCDQHENPANGAAHEFGTAVELWKQCGEDLDAIVAFVGSGGALGGLARGLRRHRPELGVYVIEPAESMALATCCCSRGLARILGESCIIETKPVMEDPWLNRFSLRMSRRSSSRCRRSKHIVP
jgi:cysteine synthase A